MAMSTTRWAVLLGAVLVAGALVAFGLTHQAAAQDEPNIHPSTSKYAFDEDGGGYQASAVPKKVLWAVVKRNGTLARNRGALDVNKTDGGYEVLFDRGVRKCAYTATIGLSGFELSEEPGQISVAGRVGATNGVFVETTDSAGASADRGFHLVVNCPTT
jgi:hypothetical protein